MGSMNLDKEILDVFSLVGLLLVFVTGYFSALLPPMEDLIQRRAPDGRDERRALANRLNSYRKLLAGLLCLVGAILALLFPLSRRVLLDWSFRGAFPTLRAGFLLSYFLLIIVFSVSVKLMRRLSRRIADVKSDSGRPTPAPIRL
jgi:hypothetical protein